MTGKSDKSVQLEEISGTQYNGLQQAQAALLPGLAKFLADVIRRGLERGSLKVINGKVVQNDQV